jgi:hypothetical protein
MSGVSPDLSIPVGVVIERRKAASPWADFLWRPRAVLSGVPDAAAGTLLVAEQDIASFYGGAADIDLYRSESNNYRDNLSSTAPLLWVALKPTGGDPPWAVAAVTADPAEGEGLAGAAELVVEAVPMPETVRDLVTAFVAAHPVDRVFEKRKHDRADAEALARAPRIRRP